MRASILVKIAACAAAVMMTASALNAQSVPERFRGVWQDMEGKAGACRQADWNSDRHADTHIKVEARKVRFHESECRYTSVRIPSSDRDHGAARLAMSCEGEGEKWKVNEIWQTQTIQGAETLTMAGMDRKNPRIVVYQKCNGGPVRADAKPAEGAPVGEPQAAARPPDAEGKGLKAAMAAGRHCFSLKEQGADLLVDIKPSGAVAFALDVLHPYSKHLCHVSGTAAANAGGWRFTETNDGRVCRVDLVLTDRLTVRLDDEACERHYCGARASVAGLQFALADKRKTCPR